MLITPFFSFCRILERDYRSIKEERFEEINHSILYNESVKKNVIIDFTCVVIIFKLESLSIVIYLDLLRLRGFT